MDEANKGPCFGMRHAQSLLLFINMMATCICRWNISAALLAMAKGKHTNRKFPEFDWSEKEFSYIHSSFFWGYVIAQYPGGVLAKYYGSKPILGLSSLITAVLSAVIPGCVVWGNWPAFCGIRAVQGLAQGVVFPCAFDHLAKWAPQTALRQSENNPCQKKIPVPWKTVLTSMPFIAFVVAHCTLMWGICMLSAQIPLYFSGVLNMNIKTNALFSALPFLASWLMTYVFMVCGDLLQHYHLLTLTTLRRLFNSIASWIPAACLIAIGFLEEGNRNLALTLMVLGGGVISGCIVGSALNIIDLTPNHTNVLYAITNTVASMMAVIAPLATGAIVTNMHNPMQWQLIFAISAVILFLGNLLYIIFLSTEIQPWDADGFLQDKGEDNPGGRGEVTKIT